MTARARTIRPARTAAGAALVRGVAVTHPDRVINAELGLTKLDLVRYYDAVADVMLPHVRDRPLTLVQCAPDVAHCRYLRHSGVRAPAGIRVIPIEERTKVGDYMVIDDATGLLTLAQRNIVEFHTWNSTSARLERPDRVVLDLDPGPAVAWRTVVAAARLLRRTLADLGLRSWVKSTGGHGLHVVAPIAPTRSWEACLEFARTVAFGLVEHDPDTFTTRFAKQGREAQILVDYLRNNRTNTAVAAYSARSRANATVSTPLSWDELSARLKPERWTIRTVPRRVKTLEDPWSDYLTAKQSLPV